MIASRIHRIGHFKELHHSVQQPVDHLEARRGVVEHRREVSLVSSANLSAGVAQDNIADLEELER